MAKYRYYLGSVVNLLLYFKDPLLIVRIFTGNAGNDVKTIRVRKPALQFQVRSPMDVWSVKEATVDRLCERYGYALQPGWTIVDIGAAIGEFAIHVAAMDPRNRVLAFEPFPQSFALMEQNIRQNQLENVQAFPEAVRGNSGSFVLDLSSGEPLQFESKGLSGKMSADQIAVNSVSLADVVERTGTKHIDLLKLDCEGAEFDILISASSETLRQIDRIVMEYHDTLTEYAHGDLERFLKTNGFTTESVPNVVHPDEIGYLCASR